MKAIIRKDEDAVSPVIATILMVAITVVLAAVLYVMVSGLITTPTSPSTGWGINLGKSTDGTNWTLSMTTVPSGSGPSTVYVTVTTGSGATITSAVQVSLTTIATGGQTNGNQLGYGMYWTPLKSGSVSAGDTVRLSTAVYPSGYTVQVMSGSSVVYTHTLSG